ncbi:hypothetical protein AAC387_Pa03g3801 [Persea americana]
MASVTVSRKQSVKGARARPSKLSFLCRRSGELSCQCQTVLGNECEKVSRIYSDLTHGECKERGKRKHNYITRISPSLFLGILCLPLRASPSQDSLLTVTGGGTSRFSSLSTHSTLNVLHKLSFLCRRTELSLSNSVWK